MATPDKPHPFDTMMSFGKFVPGFDFLQGLMNNADKTLPSVGQWVAPTLDPKELDKRISDLKAVLFWLEQNSRMLSATIQALEVQRMTLSTLQSMNVNMADLREVMKVAPAPAPAAPKSAAPAEPPASPAKAGLDASDDRAAADAKPAVDPMVWWNALTKQFSELANNAVHESFKGMPGTSGPSGKRAGDKAAGTPAARQSKRAPGTAKSASKRAAKSASGGAAKTTTAKAPTPPPGRAPRRSR